MKCLGIDYGAKRIGLAISNAESTIAFPREVLGNDTSLIRHLVDIVRAEAVGLIIIGDTLSHGGAENPITKEAQRFGEDLERLSGVKVEYSFELFSSIEASRYAPKGKEHDDSAAAAIILQRYLDMKK